MSPLSVLYVCLFTVSVPWLSVLPRRSSGTGTRDGVRYVWGWGPRPATSFEGTPPAVDPNRVGRGPRVVEPGLPRRRTCDPRGVGCKGRRSPVRESTGTRSVRVVSEDGARLRCVPCAFRAVSVCTVRGPGPRVSVRDKRRSPPDARTRGRQVRPTRRSIRRPGRQGTQVPLP